MNREDGKTEEKIAALKKFKNAFIENVTSIEYFIEVTFIHFQPQSAFPLNSR